MMSGERAVRQQTRKRGVLERKWRERERERKERTEERRVVNRAIPHTAPERETMTKDAAVEETPHTRRTTTADATKSGHGAERTYGTACVQWNGYEKNGCQRTALVC